MKWLGRTCLLFAALLVLLLAFGPVTGEYRTLTVLSGSMRPYMQPGDVVVVTPVRARELREGDVITYYLPGAERTLVTHRIVKILSPGDLPIVQTKGDANNAPDAVARLESSEVWRAHTVVPKFGWALNALRSPKARLAGTVIAPIMLLGVWLLTIWGKPDQSDPSNSAELSNVVEQAPDLARAGAS